ncbi:cytochrome b5 domain-containing protein [Methylibium sp.]|uniref:cytochrome b5 domain-containing protein n=1 Tax=Methylibium sp. TaxID=2067992 RepID=UPI00286AE6B9|nr:cytochrome b5 domain-containing protein [Methylibium sp.]
MRAMIVGAGMGGLFTALALRQAGGAFASIDVYEQTKTPGTAGAGLNIPPNGARLCKWLGVDLDGGDPKGPVGAVDGGRAAILEATRQVMPDGTVSRRPIDHNTSAGDGAGFHHMHRLDLLMCLYKRVYEFGPESGAECPIRVHMGKRLALVTQDAGTVTASFDDGSSAEGELLVGADGINSKVLELLWPNAPARRWTDVVCYRGLIPRDKVAQLRKADGSPLDHNPVDSFSMDSRKNNFAWCMSYWVRGGELLNVWLGYYEPDSSEFNADWRDWFPVDHGEIIANMHKAFGDDPRKHDIVALAGAMERPTKWGLYDRDAFEHWQDGRICLLGDAAHSMLPTFGQGAAQSFEDAAALCSAFKLHQTDVYSALLHYERVRHYRATRFQFASKFAFKHLEPEDSPERRQMLKTLNERDYPVFDHEKRAGDDDSWIYAFDARRIGDKLPPRKLGPWDFRSRDASREARKQVALNLWKPDLPLQGGRNVTRAEVAQHNRFEDCWIIIRGKVYDFNEWKDRHPGGPFVARMFAGKDATAEFGDFHSPLAVKHMTHFWIGDVVD